MANPGNNVNLIGRLGRDPEFRYTTNQVEVASFSIAVNDQFKKDTTHWFDCTAWRKTAEFAANYCKKGDRIAVVGHLVQEKWTDQSGEERRRIKVEVESILQLTPKDHDEEEAPRPKPKAAEEPRRRKPAEDEEEEPRPKKRRVVEDEEEEPRPKKRRPVEDEEDEPAPKKKAAPAPAKPASKKGKATDDEPAHDPFADEDGEDDEEEYESV